MSNWTDRLLRCIFSGRRCLTASAVFVLVLYSPAAAQNSLGGDIRVRVRVLNTSGYDPALAVGPQSALEIEWTLHNDTGHPLEIAPPDVLGLSVSAQGAQIAVRTKWAPTMRVVSGSSENSPALSQPVSAATLADGARLVVRSSTTTPDQSPFAPREYAIRLHVDMRHVFAGGLPSRSWLHLEDPVDLRILPLDSPARRREFHSAQGMFYRDVDPARALEHFKALAALPDAPWSDSLPLAEMYGELGRHREACEVFRKVMPDLTRLPDAQLAKYAPQILWHLRAAARSFAMEGDTATAANLLRLEGRTPAERIPAEIERLRTPRREPEKPRQAS